MQITNPFVVHFKSSRTVYAAVIPWLLTMISLPVVGWVWGEAALIRGMSVGVVMQAIAVLTMLHKAWGAARTWKTFAAVAILSYFAELLGSTTGIPFGKYHYTPLLQPQIAGVPLLIPLAWMMMLPPAWAVGRAIAPKSAIKQAVFAALAFTAWDLFLDPQMVGWGFWVWEIPGQYFGIPLINYVGWFLVSLVITLIIRPRELPMQPLFIMYVLTWFLQTIGQGLFWAQPGPALAGFFGCGIFIYLAQRNVQNQETRP